MNTWWKDTSKALSLAAPPHQQQGSSSRNLRCSSNYTVKKKDAAAILSDTDAATATATATATALTAATAAASAKSAGAATAAATEAPAVTKRRSRAFVKKAAEGDFAGMVMMHSPQALPSKRRTSV
jgi:hypothetical protein